MVCLTSLELYRENGSKDKLYVGYILPQKKKGKWLTVVHADERQ